MTKIPLILKLRKRVHKDVASAQDVIVEEIYKVLNDAVMHGGTAIWRCYSGNRFSEDIDMYLPRNKKRLDKFFDNLESRGFQIKKRKETDNALYSNLNLNGEDVRFEALFNKVSGSLAEYETVDGNLITIYTLTPEELIREKVGAYLTRRKVRDLYDIYFLLRHAEKGSVSKELERLVKEFKPPVDERELRVLIIQGLVPSVKKMLEYIRRF
jgi:predicted nucleotidyltransferase component of viral defense system